ncbi:MAG: hypothetical protein MZU97_19415 [Bacillus subtilis]|nr:hypothetical protein [Bacillus subtilis]
MKSAISVDSDRHGLRKQNIDGTLHRRDLVPADVRSSAVMFFMMMYRPASPSK